jgi:hypothetical protein
MKSKTPPEYFLGLDLGQATDWSALAILERSKILAPEGATAASCAWRFRCRGLKRWRLGTSYAEIVDELAALVNEPPLRQAHLAMDASGVGRPILDMLHKTKLPVQLAPVVITVGSKESYHNGYYHVAKVILVQSILIPLQQRRLHLVRALPETAALVKELHDYRVQITQAATEIFNARAGAHDDLVLAVALAAWNAQRMPLNQSELTANK